MPDMWWGEPAKIDGGVYIDWKCKNMRTLNTGIYIPFDIAGSPEWRSNLIEDIQNILDKYFDGDITLKS